MSRLRLPKVNSRTSFDSLENLGNLGDTVASEKKQASGSGTQLALKVFVGRHNCLKVDYKGNCEDQVLDRVFLRNKLKIQSRDQRILEPHLSSTFPAAVLCREKALLVNLEGYKAIIAEEEAYVFDHEAPRVRDLVKELVKRLRGGMRARRISVLAHENPDGGSNGSSGSNGNDNFDPSEDVKVPFELRVLDVIFEKVCARLDLQWNSLEQSALPALDDLTRKVSSAGLERVRRVKNHMTRLTSKVEDFKDVIQHYLDDDKDMYDIIISKKQGASSTKEYTTPIQAHPSGGSALAHALEARRGSDVFMTSFLEDDEFQEAEMLFESYFILVDNIFDKLKDLSEYIDDTEDLINIELDHHRNQLIQLELILTTATFSIALIGVVSGIFGMNIRNDMENSNASFLWVTILSCVGSVVIFIAIVLFCRYKRLMLF